MHRGGLWLVLLLIVGLFGMVVGAVPSEVEALQTEADRLYSRWDESFDFAAYQSDLQAAIGIYREILEALDSEESSLRSHVLVRLSQALFEYATAYLEERDDLEAAYTDGKDYALEALRLDPAFVATEEQSFREALVGSSDGEALFWYANNLGRYLAFHPFVAIMGGMQDIFASFERVIELDETLLGGGPWRALGSFLAEVPEMLGGDLVRAEEAFRRAIALDPEYLENRTRFAEYVLVPTDREDEACAMLREALADGDDPSLFAVWPLYNTLALRQAREVITETCPGP